MPDADESDWRATFKHHLAFAQRADGLHSGGVSERLAASALRRQGVLSFIVSAPRSLAGKWCGKLGSDSPITGDGVRVVLDWAGSPPSRQ